MKSSIREKFTKILVLTLRGIFQLDALLNKITLLKEQAMK